MGIEYLSFSSPWDRDTFLISLEDDRSNSCVAIVNGVIVGYCLAINHTNMVHILNLAVHPEYRRQGIAKEMVKEILMEAAIEDKLYAVLEVRRSNNVARSLYSSMGFSHASTWHRYYTDTDEDAAIMVKDLRSNTVKDVECAVVLNMEVSSRTFYMALEGALPFFSPGQFAMIQVSSGMVPFLRRPLAILGQDRNRLELLYRVKGEGTRMLSEKREGDKIKILGPLGKGFTRHDGKRVIYIAGGTGLPPILSLAERIRSGHLIIGAKRRGDLPLLDRIRSIKNTEAIVMTEDGSLGKKGMATDAMNELVGSDYYNDESIIYACGPEGMLKEIAKLAARTGIPCEISLEERMSCGFGACTGCVVRTINGNKRVCREGPVFDALDIIWS